MPESPVPSSWPEGGLPHGEHPHDYGYDESSAATTKLTHIQVDELARYNTEVSRGLVHTAEKKARMAELQHRFDTVGFIPRRRRRLRPDV